VDKGLRLGGRGEKGIADRYLDGSLGWGAGKKGLGDDAPATPAPEARTPCPNPVQFFAQILGQRVRAREQG
jgi:hypothetical protein